MINVSLQVRRAVEQDHDQIANLIYYESNTHRHLDWHSPLEWIGSPNYWVREEDGHITAALACPEDPPHVAWIRFFGHHQISLHLKPGLPFGKRRITRSHAQIHKHMLPRSL